MKKRLTLTGLLVICFILTGVNSNAQCLYTAFESFTYAVNTSLENKAGGTGWLNPWSVQNNSLPGYQIPTVAGSLTYGLLQNSGNMGAGGNSYTVAGRNFNYNDGGPFDPWIATNTNSIGTETGTVLWFSFLLRKDENNDEEVYTTLHNSNAAIWITGGGNYIGMGYMGTASNNAGTRYWSFKINNTTYRSTVPVVAGTAVFYTVKLTFNAANTLAEVFINPPSLGNIVPAVPDISQNLGFELNFRSMAMYLGDNPGSGAIDEIRFAPNYACVAPDNTITVNQPPIAIASASSTVGQAPYNINFTGSSSYDPEGQSITYLWNFNDGSGASSTSTLANPSHTFSAIGQYTVNLRVTEPSGQNTSQTILLTILDANNTFPCQTSFTVLNMASCGQSNARVRINNVPSSFTLRNSSNAVMPVTGGNEYHNLAPGTYQYTASGTNLCKDTFNLVIDTDSATCAGWSRSTCNMNVGVNISALTDWENERPFKNLFKHIREFITYVPGGAWDANVNSEMATDADGYPLQIPQTTSAGNTNIRYFLTSPGTGLGTNLQQGKRYVILYNGIGTWVLNGNYTLHANTPGRIEFTMNDNQSLYCNITSSVLGNHIRNVRLLRIEDETADLNANPFYTGFLNKMQPLKSIRLLNYTNANNGFAVNWATRYMESRYTYSGSHGSPWEMAIKLCNIANKDMWICTPHLADDAYLTQLATLVRDNLNPGLTVYIEYSNEVWNWIFPQSQHNIQNMAGNLNYGRAYAQKAKRVFDIFHSVFGAQSTRVKRVLGLQSRNNSLTQEIISQLKQSDWDYASPSFYFDLNHTASGNPVLNASSTAADVMTNARNEFYGSIASYKQDYLNVRLLGKKVINYEGGQHFANSGNLIGTTPPYQTAIYAAQYSAEMYNLTNEVVDSVRNWGSDMAVYYTLTGENESIYGSWGSLDDIDIAPPYMVTAPKYQAILDNLPPAGGCFVTLPVEEILIEGRSLASANQINFRCNSDKPVLQYQLEKGLNGRSFILLKEFNTASAGSWLSAIDDAPFTKTFYRIKVIFADNSILYSSVIFVNRNQNINIVVSPNPASETVQVALDIKTKGPARLSINDYSGRELESRDLILTGSAMSQMFVIRNYPPGVYFIKVQGSGVNEVRKLVVR